MAQDRSRNRADDVRRQEAVLSKAAIRAGERLGLANVVLAKVLGLSEASVSRMRSGEFLLSRDSKPFELAQLFVRLFRSLDAITGGDDASSRSWIVSENLVLKGRPVELIKTIRGLTATVAYVDSRRAVV
jgi:hypothetical protein